MLAPVLQAAGYDVMSMASGREALALIERGARFDVVVTDIEMPELDGFAFAEAVRSHAGTAHVPVIGLSSAINGAAIAKSERAGMYGYVAKFDRRGLLHALKNAVSQMQEAA
jgi:two-component system chemotaxis sensor kinase CheA